MLGFLPRSIPAPISTMLAQFAKQAAASLGLRCSAPALLDGSSALRSLAVRGYAQGEGWWGDPANAHAVAWGSLRHAVRGLRRAVQWWRASSTYLATSG